MIEGIATLATLGFTLGLFLALAARFLKVEADPIVDDITAMLPGSNCGQCGFAGCGQAAEAMAEGTATLDICPPGGKGLIENLAARLGVDWDFSNSTTNTVPMLAYVQEATCIGCTRCFKACPTDAIIGAPKQMHSVIDSACNGCTLCIDVCPTECLQMVEVKTTLTNWRWNKPLPLAQLPLAA
ncbi:MAG: electron transporter RnfB [Zetaproteobacteria bacterium CG_4_9_14_3_um_filter_54_145]|nr:MAG: electron transporter RnfB [Zetaproteobacteria bacterium CG_4_9_14_3_um_filter_54_145]